MRQLIIAIVLLLPVAALADGEKCWLVSNVAAASIAAGAVTTSALNITDSRLVGKSHAPIASHLKIGLNLVDAGGGVTDLTLTFTAAEVASGTDRAVAAQDTGASTALARSWNPTVGGKAWLSSVPWKAPLAKITVTPTGHGAGDTVALAVYGCTGTP